MKLRYTHRSKDDLDIAMAWYEKQRRSLGFEFLDRIEVAVKSIVQSPELHRVYYSQFRGCLVRRFPFIVFYTIEGDEIIVHSIFDCRQDPQKRP
ncbi:MAG TPA: type II toxin-antitoxin system RelE/ParE family toxin [Chlorobaculum parvum]|uniref:Type II toxin-antitoxin system RelE/ParE family toxin n=1 Tax=Chlorobaculum parvum TaxID=274539 RepID=A0A7C5HNG8_9CHLB|nr:type II toxin-antitoxin system RelE/ParE family toxin [Chlorobaculum parvum]